MRNVDKDISRGDIIGNSSRWNYIDLLETLGIVFVVSYHSTTYSYNWMTNGSFVYYIRYYLTSLLSTCVPLFFFANGYLLFNRSFNIKRHIKKIFRLIVLSAVWISIILLFYMLKENTIMSLQEFLKRLISIDLLHWNNHFWFMKQLIFIYIVFPILKKLYDYNRAYFRVLLLVCFIFSFGVVFLQYGCVIFDQLLVPNNLAQKIARINHYNPIYRVKGYSFVYFGLGGEIHNWTSKAKELKYRKVISLSTLVISCFLLFLCGIVISNNKTTLWETVWNGYDTVFTLCNVFALYLLSVGYDGRFNLIKQISCNTLGIYFMHTILIQFTRSAVVKIPSFCTFLGCLLYAITLMLLCTYLSLIMKKIPILRYLFEL